MQRVQLQSAQLGGGDGRQVYQAVWLCIPLFHLFASSPYGSLETRGPDEDRLMNDSNGSLIAVRCEATNIDSGGGKLVSVALSAGGMQ